MYYILHTNWQISKLNQYNKEYFLQQKAERSSRKLNLEEEEDLL